MRVLCIAARAQAGRNPAGAANQPDGDVRWAGLGAAIGLAVMIYGGLLPFTFARSSWLWARGQWLVDLVWHRPTLDDAIANIAICLPIGVMLRWSLNRWRTFETLRLATVGAVVGTISYMVESLQAFIPGRVPAWNDVCLNILGGLVGAAFAAAVVSRVRRLVARFCRCACTRPATAGFWAAATLIMLNSWLPFDFRSPAAGLAVAQWSPSPVRAAPFAHQEHDFSTAVDRLWDAGCLFVVGLLAGLSRREAARTFATSMAGAAWRVGLLVVVWEAGQICLASHAFATMTIVTRLLGGLLGICLGLAFAVRAAGNAWPGERLWALAKPALGLALVVQAALLLLHSAAPVSSFADGVDVRWLPFWSHFQRPFLVAISLMWDQAFPYALLGITAAGFFGVRSMRAALAWPLLIALDVALVAQAREALSPLHIADITEVLLAVVGGAAGAWVYARLAVHLAETHQGKAATISAQATPDPPIRRAAILRTAKGAVH